MAGLASDSDQNVVKSDSFALTRYAGEVRRFSSS